jgi:hypothetical protein
LQKINEDCKMMQPSLKKLEEVASPIMRLLVPHVAGEQLRWLVDKLKDASRRLATYVKHLAKSTPYLVRQLSVF